MPTVCRGQLVATFLSRTFLFFAGPAWARFFFAIIRKNLGFRRQPLLHQIAMHPNCVSAEYRLRVPSEPEPFPVKEPPDSPENPDMPVREPDPDQPFQI